MSVESLMESSMTTHNPLPAPSDLEDGNYAYYSLADDDDEGGEAGGLRPLTKGWWILVSGLVALVTLLGLVACIVVVVPTRHSAEMMATVREPQPLLPRGVVEGVSAKSRGGLRFGRSRLFAWTDRMLAWQRTGFHFQPLKNWMNDPNGPLYYKENYHVFYQYNPEGAVWGNIVWGHAISKDLINWEHLPIALSADEWYDINGVWTGSATILPDGQIVMLYTGYTNASVQVQNLAYPSDPSDSLLIHWSKYSGNPVLVPPPGINVHDFRDPTTAMLTTEGKWRINVGSKVNRTGISLLYDTADFKTYELLDGFLHAVQGTGMWECVDFYPVSVTENIGLDFSEQGSAVKHVLKASFDDDRNDYYAIGIYDEAGRKWVPDHGDLDLGLGWRYDYGKFYASKTFYDEKKTRRVLWGWIPESDSENADISKGWASVQAIPRTILFDKKTGMNLLQWPVEEVEELRSKSWEVNNVVVEAGSVVPLDLGPSSQLDITAEFEIGKEAVESLISSHHDQKEKSYSCAGSGGAAERGALGPFGLLVVADKTLSEQTPVYFYIVKSKDGNLTTHFCTDILRSSAAPDVDKTVYGSTVSVLDGEKLSVRILVDHSIIESFAQGGRTCITSRVYPTKAIYDDAKVFLFNNATKANVVASLKIWEMESADIHDSSSSPSLAIPRVNILGYMLPANLVLSFCILFSLVRYL